MKKLLALALTLLLAAPVAAEASVSGMYLAPKIGGAIQNFDMTLPGEGSLMDENDASFGGGLAIGYDFFKEKNVPVRVELEYMAWTQADKSRTESESFSNGVGTWDLSLTGKAKVGIQSLFANIYYDFHNNSNFTPYAGFGLGVAFVKSSLSFDGALSVNGSPVESGSLGWGSSTESVFGWNIALGCSYAFTDNFSVDLSYRYAGFGDGKTASLGDIHFESEDNAMHQFLLGLRYSF